MELPNTCLATILLAAPPVLADSGHFDGGRLYRCQLDLVVEHADGRIEPVFLGEITSLEPSFGLEACRGVAPGDRQTCAIGGLLVVGD